MAAKHALEELNNCSREELITMILMMQGQLDALNENIEKLIEQVRIANSYRFGNTRKPWIPLTDSYLSSMRRKAAVTCLHRNRPKKKSSLHAAGRKRDSVRPT